MSNYSWLPRADAFPKKNALTPVGALAFGVFGAAVAGAVLTNGTIMSWFFLGVGILPLSAAIWGFVYFAIKDPDRLQTEDYRIQKEYVARIPLNHEAVDQHIAPSNSRLVNQQLIDFGKEDLNG